MAFTLAYSLVCLRGGYPRSHWILAIIAFFQRKVRGPLNVIKEQWEGLEDLPISVSDYLSNLYEIMTDMAEIAKKRDQQAKLTNTKSYMTGKTMIVAAMSEGWMEDEGKLES